jgi:hypothetical protein
VFEAEGEEKTMANRLIDKKSTFQVRIDRGWQKILLQLRAETEMTIRALVEDALSDSYPIDKKGSPTPFKRKHYDKGKT